MRVLNDPAVVREQSVLYDARHAYVEAMAAIERRFFDRIEIALAEEQRFNLERVRLLRERERYPVVMVNPPGARVDLTTILDRLASENDFFIDDRDAFNEEIVRYERRLTSLRARCWQGQIERMTRGVELLAERRNATSDAKRDELRNTRQSLNRRTGRPLVRLRELNDRTVDRLAAHLSDAAADAFRERYRAEAYPRVFPDFHDARELLAEAAAYEDLSPEIREALTAVAERYEREVDQLNREMKRLSREFGEHAALTRRTGGQTEQTFERAMEERRERRRDLAERALDHAFELLPEEARPRFAEKLDHRRERIDSIPEWKKRRDPTIRVDRMQY